MTVDRMQRLQSVLPTVLQYRLQSADCMAYCSALAQTKVQTAYNHAGACQCVEIGLSALCSVWFC